MVKIVQFLRAKAKTVLKLLNIRTKLLIGLLVPVILLGVYGFISYRTAENTIISNYQKSSAGTLNAISDYLSFGLNIVDEKSQELVSDSGVRVYYNKRTGSEDPLMLINQQHTIQADIGLAKKTNSFIASIHVIGEYGKGLSTEVKESDSYYKAFAGSPEAKLFEDNSVTYTWIGSHNDLDQALTTADLIYNTDNYALSIVRRMASNHGYVVIDIAKQPVLDMFAKYSLGDGSIVGLVNGDGREILAGIEAESLFTGLSRFDDAVGSENPFGDYDETYKGKDYLFLYSKIAGANVTVCALIPTSTILKEVAGVKTLSLAFSTIACVFAALMVFFIAGGVSRAIRSLMKSMEQASKGDLTTQFTAKSHDEFLVLADGISNMLKNMRLLIGEVQDVGGKVSSSAGGMSVTSEELLVAAKGISKTIDDIENGVVQQADDTEQCLLQMTELSEQINHVYNNANEIEQIADNTKTIAGEGRVIVNELNEKAKATADITQNVISKIQEFENHSKNIAGFVSTINEIASQTNLLSLNASIEAARAGDAGRGFAVVADEIRKLADQSVQAANQIQKIVKEIAVKTMDTVETAKHAENIVASQTTSLNKTVQVFDSINSHVNDLANNLNNIANGIKKIENAKNDTMDAIQNISAVSEETAASSEEVSATAINQIDAVERMRLASVELANDARILEEAIKAFKII
jgi:methyl-accepting chemotaxis protein